MAGPTGAIRAGRAFVEMFADPSKLVQALEGAKRRVLAFGAFFAKVGASAAAIGGSVFAPITKMFTAAVEEGADISKLASQLGSTAEQVSRLRGAFAQGGVAADEFAGAMTALGDKISHAADGNGFLLDSMQSLGTARDFMGKGLDEQLDTIAERIRAIGDARDQARAGKELGFSAEMVEVLKKGKQGLDEYRAAAERNGDVMSTEQVKQAKEAHDEFNRVLLAGKSTLLEVGKALLPTGASFTSIGKDIRDGLETARNWIREHRQIIVTVTAAAGALVAGGLAVASFGAAVSVTAPIIGGLALAVGALKAIFFACISPIGLAVAAVAAAAVGIGYLISRTEAGRAAIADLKGAAGDAAEFIKGSWKGITDALSAGNFRLAFEIGLKSAEVAWNTFVVKLTTAWIGFKSVFVDTWEEATGWIAKAMIHLGASLEKNLLGALRKVIDGFNLFAGAIDDSLKINLPGVRSDAEIERERDDMKRAIDDITAAEKKRRNEFRAGQVKDAQTALDIAKEQLEILKKQAEESAWDAIPWAELEDDEQPQQKPPSFAALSELAKGTFGGGSIQQALGYGDNVGQRQLDAQTAIQSNTSKTVEILEKIADKPGQKFT